MRHYDEGREYSSDDIRRIISLLNSSEVISEELFNEIEALLLDDRYADVVTAALSEIWDDIRTKEYPDAEKDAEAQIALEGIIRKCHDFPVRPRSEAAADKCCPLWQRIALRVAAVVVPLLLLVAGAAVVIDRPCGAKNCDKLTVESAPQTFTFEGTGEAITLPDGSTVKLDEGAALEYQADFLDKREVTLHGTAFFSVVKRDGKSFEVLHEGMTIRVLGTEFYVCDKDEATEITLCSGSVEVSRPGMSTMLKPNQRLITDLDGEPYSVVELSDAEIARLQFGKLELRGATLSEALRKTGEFFGCEVEIGPVGESEPIWMELRADNSLEEVLFVMQTVSGNAFSYRICGNRVEVSR